MHSRSDYLALIGVAAFCFAPMAAAGAAESFHTTPSGLTYYEWLPPQPGQGLASYPLIVFSHGDGGCGTQSSFLTAALAARGYVVIAPNHSDAHCGRSGAARSDREGDRRQASKGEVRGRIREALRERIRDRIRGDGEGQTVRHDRPSLDRRNKEPENEAPPFRSPDDWTDATHRDRLEDVVYLLDYLHQQRPYATLIDFSRVGIVGHSLGGYTGLAMAGAWPSWKDQRIRLVVALSPFAAPFLDEDSLGKLGVPVMYQGGTADIGITPAIRRPNGAYDQTSSPAYYVEFKGAGHFAWTNLKNDFQPQITAYAASFIDLYIKGTDNGLLDQPPMGGVSDYRHK